MKTISSAIYPLTCARRKDAQIEDIIEYYILRISGNCQDKDSNIIICAAATPVDKNRGE